MISCVINYGANTIPISVRVCAHTNTVAVATHTHTTHTHALTRTHDALTLIERIAEVRARANAAQPPIFCCEHVSCIIFLHCTHAHTHGKRRTHCIL